MKLSHYGAKPIALSDLYDVATQPTKDAIKPKGLWVSCDGQYDWESWCRAEDFRLEHAKFRQEVTLRSNVLTPLDQCGKGLVLHLANALDIDNFTKIYKTELYPGDRSGWINWPAVAVDYDGMIVSPYIWDRRLSGPIRCMWYYPWDCASGCLWRPTKLVESIGEPVPIDWTIKLLTQEDKDDGA